MGRIIGRATRSMKLQASPATDPRAGSRATIRYERSEVDDVLKDSPSLRPTVPAVIEIEASTARRIVGEEMRDFGEAPQAGLAELRYSADQVFGD